MARPRKKRRLTMAFPPPRPPSFPCPPTCSSTYHRIYRPPISLSLIRPPPPPPPPPPPSYPPPPPPTIPPRSPHSSAVPLPLIPRGFFLSQGIISIPPPTRSSSFTPLPPHRSTIVVVSSCKKEERIRELNSRGTTRSPITDMTAVTAIETISRNDMVVLAISDYIKKMSDDNAATNPPEQTLINERKADMITRVKKYDRNFNKLMQEALETTNKHHPVVPATGRPEQLPVPELRLGCSGEPSKPMILQRLIKSVEKKNVKSARYSPYDRGSSMILAWDGNGGGGRNPELRDVLVAAEESMEQPERVQFVSDDGDLGLMMKDYMVSYRRLLKMKKKVAMSLSRASMVTT